LEGSGTVGVTDSVSWRTRQTLSKVVLRPSVVALAVVTLVSPFLSSLPPVVRYAPFALSLVVLGLPHGALDHLAPGRTLGTDPSRRSMLFVGLVYLVLGGAYLGWWFLEPVTAAVAFILLTWFHWGQGDLYALVAFTDAEHLPTRRTRALTLAVRGAMPMLVPFVAHPAPYRAVVAAFVGLFGASDASLAVLFGPTVRLVVAALLVGLSLATVGLGYRRVRAGAARGPWVTDVAELGLLWVFFVVVPPVLAIGVYFCLWHSLRHIARLALVDTPSHEALSAGEFWTPVRRFARDAAPLTAGALVFLVGLFFAVPRQPGGPRSLLALYLVGIAALTLPHVAVVTWMDVRQGVW
jgi:Brp/Blh family beta-carotene 15,15'-monooxygenase